MKTKRYLVKVVLLTTLNVVFACSRYPLEAPEKRSANEVAARELYEPLQQYFVENDTYPENLSSLVPEYISELPETVSGNAFQYGTSDSGEKKTSFRIYWYQKNVRDGEIIACSVNPPTRGSERTYESNDCWKPKGLDH